MNLINDAWIPVRRADGSPRTIAPWQLTERIAENPNIAIASPRPDFDGALVQFLIGVLQTTCTPDEKRWWDWRAAPPATEILRKAFSTVAHAFDLFGNKGPLFMQERFADLKKTKTHPISYLLIGAATRSTRDQNIDHFQKRIRDSEECLCKGCAAAALFTLQTFAPSGGGGGEGKFTSIRGGGPLSTIMLGDNLWETCWLNVHIGSTFSRQPPTEKLFPWLCVSAFINDKKPVKIVRSDEMDPRHVYWGLPRRVLLHFETTNDSPLCRACGTRIGGVACRKYFDISGGLTYQEKVGSAKKVSWIHPRHPLSPYNEGDDQRPTAVHPRPGGMGYRHWLGWVENTTDGSTRRLPATVVEQFRSVVRKDGRLWAFGYDMENMKARCWYESIMPLIHAKENVAPVLSAHLSNMVRAARFASGLVTSAVIKATLLEPTKKTTDEQGMHVMWKWPRELLSRLKRSPTERSDAVEGRINSSVGELDSRVESSLLTAPLNARSQFWAISEAMFFRRAYEIRDSLNGARDEMTALRGWHADLERVARQVFYSFTQVGDFDAGDPRRVALAQFELDRTLHGSVMRKILSLPAPDRKAA